MAPLLLQDRGNYYANGAGFGGVAFGSYAQLKTAAPSGRLLGSINHAAGYSPMLEGKAQLLPLGMGHAAPVGGGGHSQQLTHFPRYAIFTAFGGALGLASPAPAPAKYFTRTGTISSFSATPIEDIATRNQPVGVVVDLLILLSARSRGEMLGEDAQKRFLVIVGVHNIQ